VFSLFGLAHTPACQRVAPFALTALGSLLSFGEASLEVTTEDAFDAISVIAFLLRVSSA
jgi:hypothetical protein